jgi:hypothetical protein
MLVGCASPEPSPSGATPGEKLVSIVDEPAGEHCENGGSAVQSGIDDNHDGVLDAAEVDEVAYVCNAAGTPTLVRETTIEAGDVCPGGGTKIQTGRDLDHDGMLSDAEVEQTVTVCDTIEIWNGPLTTSSFTTAAQLDVLANIRVINGSLTVDNNAEMSKLELVNGDVAVSGDEVELPALRTIVGDLSQDSYSTTLLALPVLERIGGELHLEKTAQDATISAPALVSVGNALTFIFLTGGDTIDLSGLKDVGGDLFLDSDLPDLSLTKLTTIAGSLQLRTGTTIANLPALKTVGGTLDVSTSHLTDLTLPALESIAGDVKISFLTPLTSLRFAALKTIGGSVSIDLETLATLDLTALTDVGHDIVIMETLLTSLQLPNLRHIGLSDPTENRSLLLAKNEGLATIDLSSLQTTDGWITVSESDALTKLTLPALTNAYEVAVQYCPAFSELRAPELTEVTNLTLWNLPQLTVADFPKLTRVTTHVGIYRTGLQTLTGLSALTYTGYLELQDDEQLVDLHGLENVTLVGHIHVNSNGNLVSLAGLENLTRASGIFELTMNTKLTDVTALASLRYIGMEFRVEDNTKLVSLAGLEHLATIQNYFSLAHNNMLASLAGLAGLTFVGGAVDVHDNAALPPGEVTALRTRLGK